MKLSKVNLSSAFETFNQPWSPRVGGNINDFQIKLVKLQGEFHWHHHDNEDELFLVVKGTMLMKLEEQNGGDITVNEGEYIIIPHGVRHCPVALTDEVQCLLLEPNTTLNTGDVTNERTARVLQQLA